MSSGSDCVSEESLLQDFRERIGLKKKLMLTADGRAPPGTLPAGLQPGATLTMVSDDHARSCIDGVVVPSQTEESTKKPYS